MTDHQPLTAAQIAEIEARAMACKGHGVMARGLIKTDIPALVRDLRAARAVLRAINRRLSQGDRNFDDLIREAGMCADLARAALPEETPNG